MAVLKQDKRMIELLLDHGADVNCKEQVFVNFENFYEHGVHHADDIFFLDKAQYLHYWPCLHQSFVDKRKLTLGASLGYCV